MVSFVPLKNEPFIKIGIQLNRIKELANENGKLISDKSCRYNFVM